tara:strand:- start:33 stop:389 length:357 start_codon:yes stop_codon:yes gene_type:complete
MVNKKVKVKIQFIRGKDEKDYPEIRLYRNPDGHKGKATYKFYNPSSISVENFNMVEKMYLIDEEGELSTRKIDLSLSGNCIKEIKSTYSWNSQEEFKRFMRFAHRHAQSHINTNEKTN